MFSTDDNDDDDVGGDNVRTGSCYCCFDFNIPIDNRNRAHVYGQNVCAIYEYNEACDDGICSKITLTVIITLLDLHGIYKYYPL